MIKIGIIGCGNMGAAIISKIKGKYDILVVEKEPARVNLLKKKYKVSFVGLGRALESSDVIILAVKPQNFDEVLSQLSGLIAKNQLVISIAAGITTEYIEKRLGRNVRVIRTMPNLPAQIGEGMTGICKGKKATPADLREAVKIFENIGKTLIVQEKWIDAITAVSGSGPAYVFLFAENFIKAAKALGFNDAQAKALVSQTMRGSLDLLEQSTEDAGTLRERVTSKGGTTAAALEVFGRAGYEKTFKNALMAAKKRAKELAK